LIKSYLFIPYVAPDGTFDPLYGVGWTLNFEMFFYVLFAAAIWLRREVAVACVAIALLIGIAAGHFLHPTIAALKFWSDPIVLEFAFGMGVALAYRRGARLPAWLGGALCLIGAIAMWRAVAQQPPSSYRWLHSGIPAAAIFAGAVLQPPTKAPLRWLNALGDASYSIYLLHTLVIAAIFGLWHSGLNTYPIQNVMIAGFLLTIALALASYRLFEVPVALLMRRTFETTRLARPSLRPQPDAAA
jgi:exopolysaccharide production protein ExoZ